MYILLTHVALAIAIISVTRERIFPSMRRTNAYLRSDVEHDKFTDRSVINIERELSNKIGTENIIINHFAEKGRRMQL